MNAKNIQRIEVNILNLYLPLRTITARLKKEIRIGKYKIIDTI